jgi:hypothetical protein
LTNTLGTHYNIKNFVDTAGRWRQPKGFACVWVTDCVLANPDGSEQDVSVSIAPWTLSTGKGVLTPRAGGESGGFGQPLFP